MGDTVLSDLQFPAVLELLRAETSTPPGASLALSLRPSFDPGIVQAENQRTVEAGRFLASRGALPFAALPDPAPLLERLAVEGSILAPLEVSDLLAILHAGRNVKGALAEARNEVPRLWDLGREIPDLGNLLRFLDGKISASGEVLDHASDDLQALRQQIQERSRRLGALLETVVARPEVARALQDDFVSLRNERHVIPIRAEAKAALQGIVHAVSGTGATVYVEPLETVDLNNEIVTLRDGEAAEVRRLLREYSDLLRGRLPELRTLADRLGRLDLVLAKARLGARLRAIPAEAAGGDEIVLRGARHPLVEASLTREGARMMPLDLDLLPGSRVLMISGPNAGGKTVALKTVGLLSFMFQSGLPIPADRAVLPVFRGIFADIGDHQSISDRLSTFSARMKTVAEIARDLSPPALVLLDEVGAATDPEEGAALGIAIVDHFRVRGATVLATTHLEALKAYAAATEGCRNAAMQFDEGTLTPTYRLMPGIPGRSSALEIAARLSLPPAILEDARARRGESGRRVGDNLPRLQELTAELDARVRAASETREHLEAERRALTSAFEEREKRQRQAVAAEIEMAVGAIREEGELYLRTLKEREVALRMRREESKVASRLQSEARARIRQVSREPGGGGEARAVLPPGLKVLVEGMGLRGTVQSVQGDSVTVLVRGKRVTVPREECRPDGPPDARAAGGRGPHLPQGVTFDRRPTVTPEEIHLRGLSVDEALARVDKFLDDAYLASLGSVRLIHGIGSGRLKRAVGELLSRHPHVERFAGAPAEEGGVGVTIVTLRI